MKKALAYIFNWPLVWCHRDTKDGITLHVARSISTSEGRIWFVWRYGSRDSLRADGTTGIINHWTPANDLAERLIPRSLPLKGGR